MLELFKSLADPTRLRLLNVLQQGEFTVQELMTALGMGQSRVSRHLKILLEAGLLSVKREGTWAYYRLLPTTPLFTRMLPLLVTELKQLDTAIVDRAAVVNLLAARRERSQFFFDRHAGDWDRLARQLLPTPEYRARLLALLPASAILLEVGIGTGGLLVDLCNKAETVVGVDQAPAMLRASRQRIEALGLDKVDLRLGEMEHLPLDSASIDTVVLNMVLHHASDPRTVLQEVFRVLRSGGLVLIADLLRHQGEWMREKLADQWLGFAEDELLGWGEELGFRNALNETLPGDKAEYAVILIAFRKP